MRARLSEGTSYFEIRAALRRAMRLQQIAQRLQIHDVLRQVFSLRRLKHFRDFTETPVAYDKTKGVETDLALADVLVSIYA